MKAVAATALTVATLLAASGAQASLFTRLNGQAVYDDVAKLTWLQDANYAKTSNYDADGVMNWTAAMAWAAQLSIEGVSGWRLPGGPMGYGFNQTSEMGNMFYTVLGGQANTDIADTHSSNFDLFKNIQSNVYWSGVEGDSSSYAWDFNFGTGGQFNGDKLSNLFGWAVRSGDVSANPVPAPGTLALLGAGFLGWMGVKRSRHRAGAVIG